MEWTYNGQVFDETLTEKMAGFVYIVTNTITGMKYIGKKVFYFSRKKKTSTSKVKSNKNTKASRTKLDSRLA